MQFGEVIGKTKRICDYYENGCGDCPINNYCDHVLTLNPNEIKEFESIINKWQPNIYPTILELLYYIFPDKRNTPLNELVKLRLPTKIANEWGILPINEGGLNNFRSEWV